MRRYQNGRKSHTERCGTPSITINVEVREQDCWYIHSDVAASVDRILQGSEPLSFSNCSQMASHPCSEKRSRMTLISN